MNANKYEHAEIIENVAMCPPGVRTVIVRGWCDGPDPEDGGHEIHPVVAIRTFVRRRYRARWDGDRNRPRGGTHAEMIELGWRPELLPELVTEAVYADEEYGLMGNMDDLVSDGMSEGASTRIVPCPWPFEEDAERLADKIRAAEESAILIYRAGNPTEPGADSPE